LKNKVNSIFRFKYDNILINFLLDIVYKILYKYFVTNRYMYVNGHQKLKILKKREGYFELAGHCLSRQFQFKDTDQKDQHTTQNH